MPVGAEKPVCRPFCDDHFQSNALPPKNVVFKEIGIVPPNTNDTVVAGRLLFRWRHQVFLVRNMIQPVGVGTVKRLLESNVHHAIVRRSAVPVLFIW